MQIVEINLKDYKDTLVLMLEHPLGSSSDSNKHIDVRYICNMMAQDWGFYHTFTTNLKRVPDYIAEFPTITGEQGDIIRSRVNDLMGRLEDAPKAMKWKIRSKVGTRTIWYQEVSDKSQQY